VRFATLPVCPCSRSFADNPSGSLSPGGVNQSDFHVRVAKYPKFF
jgi:hypothetical protein